MVKLLTQRFLNVSWDIVFKLLEGSKKKVIQIFSYKFSKNCNDPVIVVPSSFNAISG